MKTRLLPSSSETSNETALYTVLPFILPCLKTEETLLLRQTNKTLHEAIRINQEGTYYKTKAEFTIETMGTFSLSYIHKPRRHGEAITLESKAYFDLAWSLYHQASTSESQHPAMLYKLYDLDVLVSTNVLNKFAAGENLKITARMYCPNETHAWNVNQVWLLAQIHVRRSFVILSDLTPNYIKRTEDPSAYSAFAREAASLIKIGYSIGLAKDGKHVQLSPPAIIAKRLTLADITPSDTEIEPSIELINLNKVVDKAIEHLSRFVEKINTSDFFELFSLDDPAEIIEKIIDTLLIDRNHTHKIMNLFLEKFNGNPNRPDWIPPLQKDNSVTLTFFNDYSEEREEKRIKEVKNSLIALMEDRINRLKFPDEDNEQENKRIDKIIYSGV